MLDMNIEKIVEFEKEIRQIFVGHTKRKNYFWLSIGALKIM